MANINKVKIGTTDPDAIMFDRYHENMSGLKFDFTQWTQNEAYENDITVEQGRITIRKFKPNTWIIKSPDVTGSQNSAICTYCRGTIMSSRGISNNSAIFSQAQERNNNVGAGNDTPKFRGFCPYPAQTGAGSTGIGYANFMQTQAYTWEATWTGEDDLQSSTRIGAALADFLDFRLGVGGHGMYGIWTDFTNKTMFPDGLYDFNTWARNPSNTVTWNYAFMLATGNVNDFDDGTWSAYNNATIDGRKVKITTRIAENTNGWHIGKYASPKACKVKVTGLSDGDTVYYGAENATSNNVTLCTTDGTYNIPEQSNGGTWGFGFRVWGTGTSEVTIEFVNELTDSNGLVDVSDNPIIIDLYNTNGIDASTVECWDAYAEDEHVWHKDRTVENCWKKYGMITDTWKDSEDDEEPTVHDYYKMNMSGVPSEMSNPILPETIDYEQHILPKNNSGIKPIKWNHSIANTEFWDNIKSYLLTHPVIIVESYNTNTNYSDYTVDDNNDNIIDGWFTNAAMTGDLTIKFDGLFNNRTMLNWINGNSLDTLTFQFLQDNINISVAQHLFRACTINTIKVIDKNGNPSHSFIQSRDCSGMCEFSSIKYFPDIINWNRCYDSNGNRYVPIQYMFSYVNVLTEIEQNTNVDRDSEYNVIIASPFAAQAFQRCSSLTRIGPVIDMSSMNLNEDAYTSSGDAYQMFSHCTKLSDVRLKNLNGSYVRLDGDDYLGNLISLDKDSVEYLFANLMDLTSYDAAVVTQSVNNSWYGNGDTTNSGWQYNASIWAIHNNENEVVQFRSNSTLQNAIRVPESSNSMFFYTTEDINTTITVTGLQVDDQLVWRKGESETIIQPNTQTTITNTKGTTAGFVLRRTGSSSQVSDWEHVVYITYNKVYNEYAPKAASAKLYCPEEWSDYITSEMITAANAKKWTVYIDEVEVQPS